MSTATIKEVMPEESPVYADISQQFVPFEESDQSATSPLSTEEADESAPPHLTVEAKELNVQSGNCDGNQFKTKFISKS